MRFVFIFLFILKRRVFDLKKVLGVFLAVGLLLVAGSAVAADKTFLSIATGGVAGTYYPLGGGLAQVMNSHVPDVEVTAETGNASAANINLIAGHEVSMALVQNDVSYLAAKGEKPFNKPVENLRMIASLYPEHMQCITVKDSGIKSLMEIKGKRVSVGAPGSGVAGSLSSIFSVAGLKYSDMNADFLDFLRRGPSGQTRQAVPLLHEGRRPRGHLQGHRPRYPDPGRHGDSGLRCGDAG